MHKRCTLSYYREDESLDTTRFSATGDDDSGNDYSYSLFVVDMVGAIAPAMNVLNEDFCVSKGSKSLNFFLEIAISVTAHVQSGFRRLLNQVVNTLFSFLNQFNLNFKSLFPMHLTNARTRNCYCTILIVKV
jgi:hypothetical protein